MLFIRKVASRIGHCKNKGIQSLFPEDGPSCTIYVHLKQHKNLWFNLSYCWCFLLGFISKSSWSFIRHQILNIQFTTFSTWHNCLVHGEGFSNTEFALKLCQKHASQNTAIKWLNTAKHSFLLCLPNLHFFTRNKWINLKIDIILIISVRTKLTSVWFKTLSKLLVLLKLHYHITYNNNFHHWFQFVEQVLSFYECCAIEEEEDSW